MLLCIISFCALAAFQGVVAGRILYKSIFKRLYIIVEYVLKIVIIRLFVSKMQRCKNRERQYWEGIVLVGLHALFM